MASDTGEIGKTLSYVGQLFDSVTEQQRDNARDIKEVTREVSSLAMDVRQLKTLLEIQGKNASDQLDIAQKNFDMRTEMVMSENDRLRVKVDRAVSDFEDLSAALKLQIEEVILRMDKKIDSIHTADSQTKTALITRAQAWGVAALVFAGVVVTSITTVLVTLATRPIH